MCTGTELTPTSRSRFGIVVFVVSLLASCGERQKVPSAENAENGAPVAATVVHADLWIDGQVEGDCNKGCEVLFAKTEDGKNVFSRPVDSDGSFSVRKLAAGRYRVWARTVGSASHTVLVETVRSGWTARVMLVLKPTITVHGRVRHETGGASVSVVRAIGETSSDAARETKSNAKGEYVFEHLFPGMWTFVATSDVYSQSVSTRIQVAKGSDVPPLLFKVGGSAQVTVTADGAPLANARVFLSGRGPNGELRQIPLPPEGQTKGSFQQIGELGVMTAVPLLPLGGPVSKGLGLGVAKENAVGLKSDAAGRVVIPNVPPGRYHAIATHPRYARGLSVTFLVEAKATAITKAELRGGAFITGKVSDGEGLPVFGADVSASTDDGYFTSAVTSTDGVYRLGPLSGKHVLAVSAARHERVVKEVAVGSEDLALDWVLSGGNGKLAGVVVDPSGNAVTGATVTALGRAGVSDEAGRFVLGSMPDSPVDVTVSHPGFPKTSVRLSTRDKSNRIELRYGGLVSGVVSDSGTGDLIEGAVVTLSKKGQAPVRTTTQNGRFLVGPLQVGTWQTKIKKKGFVAYEKAIPVSVSGGRSGSKPKETLFEVSRGALIAGVVRDEFGDRVVGAVVELGDLRDKSNGDGEFRFEDAPIGVVVVRATSNETTGELRLEVGPGDEVVTATIRLSP